MRLCRLMFFYDALQYSHLSLKSRGQRPKAMKRKATIGAMRRVNVAKRPSLSEFPRNCFTPHWPHWKGGRGELSKISPLPDVAVVVPFSLHLTDFHSQKKFTCESSWQPTADKTWNAPGPWPVQFRKPWSLTGYMRMPRWFIRDIYIA